MFIRENKMNFSFTFSLEQWTLAKISITLWNQDDVRDLMSNSILRILHENWEGIEKAVIEKSLKLQLPKMLNEKLLDFIRRVGFQILFWVDFHHCNNSLVTVLPPMFVWTPLGTINNIKTAKLLLKSGTLDYDRRYALACMYCLEYEIKYYWKCLTRKSILEFNSTCELYWINYMLQLEKKELFEQYDRYFMFPHTSFIVNATKIGNEAAIRYFFDIRKLIHEMYFEDFSDKIVALELYNLEEVASLHRYSDIMMFMLSKMNVKKKANMIVKYTYAFLKCLLVWPWHSLFLEMSKDKWNSLSELEYSWLLYNMVDLMCYEHDLHKLFGEFWQQSPKVYKQFFTDQCDIVYLLIGLYKRGDEKNVKLILQDSSILTKKYILTIESKQIFIYLVSSEKWDSIEFLIQECLSSREDLIRFRDVFKNVVQHLLSENEFCKGGYSKFEFIEEYRWDKFFQLIDSCISRYNKRKCIESNSSSKKHCCKDIEK